MVKQIKDKINKIFDKLEEQTNGGRSVIKLNTKLGFTIAVVAIVYGIVVTWLWLK